MSLLSTHFIFYLITNLNAQSCFQGDKCDTLISAGDSINGLISNNGDFQYSAGPSVTCGDGPSSADLPCPEGWANETFAITFNPDLCVQSVGFKYWVSLPATVAAENVTVTLQNKEGQIIADDVMATSIDGSDGSQSIKYFMELQFIGMIEISVVTNALRFHFDPTLFEYCMAMASCTLAPTQPPSIVNNQRSSDKNSDNYNQRSSDKSSERNLLSIDGNNNPTQYGELGPNKSALPSNEEALSETKMISHKENCNETSICELALKIAILSIGLSLFGLIYYYKNKINLKQNHNEFSKQLINDNV